MATLKKYPTKSYVRSMLDGDVLNQLVNDLPETERTQTVATYHGPITPDIASAWAEFFLHVHDEMPETVMSRGWTITRPYTRIELEDKVIETEQYQRYYHPEKFAEYTQDDYA